MFVRGKTTAKKRKTINENQPVILLLFFFFVSLHFQHSLLLLLSSRPSFWNQLVTKKNTQKWGILLKCLFHYMSCTKVRSIYFRKIYSKRRMKNCCGDASKAFVAIQKKQQILLDQASLYFVKACITTLADGVRLFFFFFFKQNASLLRLNFTSACL